MIDNYDITIMRVLQQNADVTNAELSEIVNLSPSQCSRRKLALEKAGYIKSYRAELDAVKLGYPIEIITRITFAAHSETAAAEFIKLVSGFTEVREAVAVTGEADYILRIQSPSLDAFADFLHTKLLPHPTVAQVRSDVVIKTIFKDRGVALR